MISVTETAQPPCIYLGSWDINLGCRARLVLNRSFQQVPKAPRVVFLSINRYERKKNLMLALKAFAVLKTRLQETPGALDGVHLVRSMTPLMLRAGSCSAYHPAPVLGRH